ncbi:DUF3572 domain-containing protein [Allosphingosinicella humi]|jgi:hypothetical protein
MTIQDTNDDQAATLALAALGWTLAEGDRAARLLALTGLTPDALRARIGEPGLLAATLAFLESHEPDLLACAEAIDVAPERLVEARRRLEA